MISSCGEAETGNQRSGNKTRERKLGIERHGRPIVGRLFWPWLVGAQTDVLNRGGLGTYILWGKGVGFIIATALGYGSNPTKA